MKLYIIRHLQTEWNKKGVLQGSHDLSILPLSPEDVQLIAERQKLLQDKAGKFDLILTSGQQRTQQTAQQYGFFNYSVEPLLNELNFGEFEGRPRDDLIAACGNAWFEDPRELVLGESIRQLESRIQFFLEKYQACEQLLVFAHGSWTRAMMSFVEVGSLKNMNKVAVVNNQLIELDL